MESATNKNGPQLIAFYGRVSTALQEDENTIENQWMELKKMADDRYGVDGYMVVREYKDEGWSGDILARPRLDQLRQDALTDMWDAVLIYDPDRLARRYSFQELVLDELKEAGKEVHFKTRSAPKDPMEKILFGVHGLFAEYERAKIAERFRLGKLRKARDKHIITSIAPYGYTLIKRRGKPSDPDFVETHLVINPVEARVVRMLFEWVGDEKLTLRKVIKRLQEMDIKPRKNSQGIWGTTTLSTLLKRETYIGNAYFGASFATVPKKPWKTEGYRKVKKTSRIMKPKEEWLPIPAPIILEGTEGKALFERTQKQLKENFEVARRNKQNHYLLAERMRCICGCSRTGEGPQKGRYLYYRCSSRVKSFPLPAACKEKGINSRIADEMVWAKIVELAGSHNLMREQIERWTKKQGDRAGNTSIDVETLQKESAKLRKQEARYGAAYAEEAIDLSQLREYTSPLKEQIAKLEQEIAKANAAKAECADDSIMRPEDVEMVATEAKKLLNDLSFEQKRDIVLDVIDRVVGVPGRLVVNGYMPVAMVSPIQYDLLVNGEPLNHVEFKTSDRNRRAAQRRKIDAF